MSLDIIDLRVLTESGTEKERWYAKRILPVRRHGNWLLCTLLIGNTAVNSALAIVTADLFGGIPGFLSSTIAILYIGEIIPQAVCHRFGLVIGAYAIPLVRLFMYVTAPLSFTTAKALDFFLGGESVTRYNKSQLKSLLSMHGTQGPDVEAPDIPPDPTAKIPADTVDLSSTPGSRVVVERAETNATVIELPQISSRTNSHATDSHHPIASQPDRQVGGVPITESQKQVTAVDAVKPASDSSPSVQSSSGTRSVALPGEPSLQSAKPSVVAVVPAVPAPDPPTSRTRRERAHRLTKFYSLKRTRMADKSDRKEKDKEKKEREYDALHPPLTPDEMAMLGGAFDFSQKTVFQVMTDLHNVFMLEASLSLNFEVLLLIFQSGHSRVPVYDKARDNIIGVLFAKDLILLDPEDSVPIKTVLLFFNRSVLVVYENTPLNEMLDIFKQGGGHMAVVRRIVATNPGEPPTLATLGVVTLEDLIEELIGQDIVDETDAYHDKNRKKPVQRVRSIDPEVLKMFDSTRHKEDLLSAKEVLVVGSYLSNNTDEFAGHLIDLEVLQDILAEIPIIEYDDDDKHRGHGASQLLEGFAGVASGSSHEDSGEVDSDGKPVTAAGNGLQSQAGPSLVDDSGGHKNNAPGDSGQPDIMIYSRGVPTKNAYLIINGRIEIRAGSDGFISEAGPWTLLGVRALTDDIYAPDFTARVSERPARLLRIPRKLYRMMVQYSAKFNPGISEVGRPMKNPVSPLSLDTPPTGKRRISEGSATVSSSSLALAAAAAAVAVGNPKSSSGEPPMPGTASDAAVVKKSRSRPNGQSIEWSEIEPAGMAAESRAGPSAAAESGPGRGQSPITLTSNDHIDIIMPVKGKSDGKPPTPSQRSPK